MTSTGEGAGLVEFYEVVPSVIVAPTSAVIVVGDVWGWNGGRIRAIADTLAGDGYAVVVPKHSSLPRAEL